MYFDRFDICEAYYLFAAMYHEGQWSREYAIFGRLNRLGFRPGACGINGPDDLTENAREIFERLVSGERKVRRV